MVEKIENIKISDIKEFGGRKYFRFHDDKAAEYAESIKAVGIQEPLIARAADDGKYELIAGHHRLKAAKMAGLSEVPVIVRELDDKQAQLCYGESNREREKFSIMERAYMAYYDDMYADTNSCDDISRRHKNDLVRLTQLIPSLQDMVDSKKISVKAGAKASQLPVEVQNQIYTCLEGNKRVLTEETVKRIKEVNENEFLLYGKAITPTKTEEILLKMQPEKIRKVSIPINRKLIKKLPEEYRTKEKVAELLEKLLEEYTSK